jgi:5,10-methylenetetrahydromethanopterin reductase
MRIGLCLSGNVAMQEIVQSARVAEASGWDSIWLGEDYFYRGGATMAAAVASATSRISIGLGIMTPLPRHPALMAMEIGALQELSGGRILPGVGAGVGSWMRQMGFDYRSPLTVMREGVELTRRLLAGETVTEQGAMFRLREVKLRFPTVAAPVLLGAVGPRALELAGEIADGTVLSVLAGPGYVRWALQRIAEGRRRAGREKEAHLVVAYLFLALADSRGAARELVRPVVAEYLSAGGANPLTQQAGLPDELVGELHAEYLRGRVPVELISDEMVDRVAAAGPAEECARWIAELGDAGADVVALMPISPDGVADAVARIGSELLPRLTPRDVTPATR